MSGILAANHAAGEAQTNYDVNPQILDPNRIYPGDTVYFVKPDARKAPYE